MGAAPLALNIVMGIPTQPFRAGLTFSGRPSGPRGICPQRESFSPKALINPAIYGTAEAVRFVQSCFVGGRESGGCSGDNAALRGVPLRVSQNWK
jgi:hypothetical protein